MSQSKYQKKDFRKVSWNEYYSLINSICKELMICLKKTNIQVNAVVPIFRGGAVAGTCIAYKLKLVTIIPVQYKYLNIKGKSKLTKVISFDSNRLKDIKRPVIVVVENNHSSGATAQAAINDIRTKLPSSSIIYIAMFADYTHRKLKHVNMQIYGKFTNETRALSRNAAKKLGITDKIALFPWELLDEELKMINSEDYNYTDISRIKTMSQVKQ
jgi:hypoxanthine phosphoribosyltransferase